MCRVNARLSACVKIVKSGSCEGRRRRPEHKIYRVLHSYYRTTFSRKIIKLLLQCFALFSTNVHFARCGCDKMEATDDQYICFNELNNAKWEFCKTCNRRSSPFCERRF